MSNELFLPQPGAAAVDYPADRSHSTAGDDRRAVRFEAPSERVEDLVAVWVVIGTEKLDAAEIVVVLDALILLLRLDALVHGNPVAGGGREDVPILDEVVELNGEDLLGILLIQEAVEAVKTLHWLVVVARLALGFSSSAFHRASLSRSFRSVRRDPRFLRKVQTAAN